MKYASELQYKDKVLTKSLGRDTPRSLSPWALNPGALPTCCS